MANLRYKILSHFEIANLGKSTFDVVYLLRKEIFSNLLISQYQAIWTNTTKAEVVRLSSIKLHPHFSPERGQTYENSQFFQQQFVVEDSLYLEIVLDSSQTINLLQ